MSKSKSKKLTNHNQLFFLHSTVIGQFLTLTASSILLLLIVDHALPRLLLPFKNLRSYHNLYKRGKVASQSRARAQKNAHENPTSPITGL